MRKPKTSLRVIKIILCGWENGSEHKNGAKRSFAPQAGRYKMFSGFPALFLSVPAVGAHSARIDTHRRLEIIEAVVAQRSEIQFLTDFFRREPHGACCPGRHIPAMPP